MNTNEPSVVSRSKIEDTDFSIGKLILLGLFSAGASFAIVYELGEYLASFRPVFLWFSLAALLMFLVVNLLTTFLVKRFSALLAIAFIETCLPLVLFTNRLTGDLIPIAVGLGLFFVFVLAAFQQGRATLANSIQIKFFTVARPVTPKLVTGALVGVSLVFYLQCVTLGGACVTNASKAMVDQALDVAKPIVNLWIPNTSADQTVNEFFRQFAVAEITSVSLGSRDTPVNLTGKVSEIPVEVRDQLITKFAGDIRTSVEQQVGPLDSTARVRDEVFRLITNYAKGLSDAAKTLASVAVAILLFFTLKGLGFLVYWLINLIAFLVYKLLIAANFATVQYETRNREFVILP